MRVLLVLILAALAGLPAARLAAQPAAPNASEPQAGQRGGSGPDRRQEARAPEGRRLPPDVTTEHVLELPGRTLRIVATAGSLPLADAAGSVQAEIAFVAYRSAGGPDMAERPVTFAVNGGPGSASAYLQLLALGPWRLPIGGASISPSSAPVLVPNAETWLDFTDLVFIDPVGTGYSRANGTREEIRDRYFDVDGDVTSLCAAITRWLRANDRLASPKFLVGESYGGFRGPLIAHRLQTEFGAALSGLVLVSPVLDFAFLSQPRHLPLDDVARLPSYAASAIERRGPVTREALAEAELYASGDYLADLLKGPEDAAAVERVSRRVAELTGLDPALVRRQGGRIDMTTFEREFRKGEGRTVSAYDTGIAGFDPEPYAARSPFEDAQLSATSGALSSAAVDLLWRRLGWRVPNQRFELLNGSVGGSWRYGRGRRGPQAMDELKAALALDPNLRVLVTHGLTDLVTPYFANALLLRQVPRYGGEPRLSLATYPGGHMFYTRDGSRTAFREDSRRLVADALAARRRD